MASQVVCEPGNAPGRGGWNPSYVIQGKLHHCMGPLYPSEGTSKAFAQTYMNDPAMGDVAPLDLRMGRIYLPANTSKPDKERVRELLDIFGQAICEHNPYVNDFVQASQLTGKDDKKAKIVINADARPAPPDGDVPASSHERRYNPPSMYKGLHGNQTYGEVSVLMPDADVGGRDVVVQFHGGGVRRIHESHRSFDPLHFVLLFPAGDDGWKINMKKNGTQQSITPCDYYAYRIQWRVNDDGSNALLMSERLFQEYCCCGFAKAEHCRLQWQRHNQTAIRAAMYQGLCDHVKAGDAGKPAVAATSNGARPVRARVPLRKSE